MFFWPFNALQHESDVLPISLSIHVRTYLDAHNITVTCMYAAHVYKVHTIHKVHIYIHTRPRVELDLSKETLNWGYQTLLIETDDTAEIFAWSNMFRYSLISSCWFPSRWSSLVCTGLFWHLCPTSMPEVQDIHDLSINPCTRTSQIRFYNIR